MLKLAKLACYFLIFHIRPNFRSNFCYYRRLESFKMILRISIVFGSRGRATEMLTMISVQKCHFLAISENWSYVYACCSFNSIIYNNFSVYIHSLDFPLIIYATKIGKFHVSQFWSATGPISPFVVLALWLKLAQRFWRRFLNFVNVFPKLSPLGKGLGPSFEQTWILITQGDIVPNWLKVSNGSRNEDFLISSMYFRYFFSPWK